MRSTKVVEAEFRQSFRQTLLVVALSSSVVVVELHEHAAPGVTDLLRQQFKGHACEIVKTQARAPLEGLPQVAVDELRPPMAWAIFRPQPAGSAPAQR
jgi:hypothetical protein